MRELTRFYVFQNRAFLYQDTTATIGKVNRLLNYANTVSNVVNPELVKLRANFAFLYIAYTLVCTMYTDCCSTHKFS